MVIERFHLFLAASYGKLSASISNDHSAYFREEISSIDCAESIKQWLQCPKGTPLRPSRGREKSIG